MKIELFYDKECPFCNAYANYIKLKENHQLTLTNARTASLELFKNKGYDINNGFIIIVDDKDIYQGSEAIIYLNKLSLRKVYFKDNFLFKNYLYPFIKFLRIIFLKILNKNTRI